MNGDRWWIWVGLAMVFLILRGVRALFRTPKKASDGMARMNAAAERILKERAANNPIPRTKPGPQSKTSGAKPRSHPSPLKSTSAPAVIRRGGLLAGREPVIQRRH
jgi:hypothetical protein